MQSPSVFNAYSRYYDLLYKDKNYKDEAQYIWRTLSQLGIDKGAQVLEFGSGTGKHGRLLAEFGFNVHGVERSPEMVALSKASPGFECQVGDLLEIQLHRQFDAVIAMFHVVSYLNTNAHIQQAFAQASRHLKPRGLFMFDVWYSPAVYRQGCKTRLKRVSDAGCEVTRFAEPVHRFNDNCVDVNYSIFIKDLHSGEVQELNECHPMRHFSLPELDYFAQTNGFKRLVAEEFLTSEPLSDATWGACFVLQKVEL